MILCFGQLQVYCECTSKKGPDTLKTSKWEVKTRNTYLYQCNYLIVLLHTLSVGEYWRSADRSHYDGSLHCWGRLQMPENSGDLCVGIPASWTCFSPWTLSPLRGSSGQCWWCGTIGSCVILKQLNDAWSMLLTRQTYHWLHWVHTCGRRTHGPRKEKGKLCVHCRLASLLHLIGHSLESRVWGCVWASRIVSAVCGLKLPEIPSQNFL